MTYETKNLTFSCNTPKTEDQLPMLKKFTTNECQAYYDCEITSWRD